jgi:hypothetical protein
MLGCFNDKIQLDYDQEGICGIIIGRFREPRCMDSRNWRRRLTFLGHQISEMDTIIHTMHNLPDVHETTVEFIKKMNWK